MTNRKRKSTPSFILTLKLNTNSADERFLEKRFSVSNKVRNQLVSYIKKQLRKYQSDIRYKKLMDKLHELKPLKMPKDEVKKLRSDINEELKELRLYYGLDRYMLQAYAKVLQHKYKHFINSQGVQLIADDVWSSVEKYLFDNGKSIHFKKANETTTYYGGKTNGTGIIFKGNHISVLGHCIPVKIDKKDDYAMESLKHRVKFCRIKRIPMGNQWHYYVQLILEGIPPKKNHVSKGNVGLDIGTSTAAVVSKNKCILEELGANTKMYTKEITYIQRKMERSRRATNPNNYKPDGTVKRGRKVWKYSKQYKMLQMHKKTLEYKQSVSLKKSHNGLANRVLAQGNNIYVEDMDFAALQKRAKETTINSKGRFNKKGRFGTSIKRHAPAAFVRTLEQKLGYMGKKIHKVNTQKFKASQYNHVTDDYIRKRLSDRNNSINSHMIQRDLYSGFLLMNSYETLDHADREKCIRNFDKFYKNHCRCIGRLIVKNSSYPSCMGLKDFYKTVTC